MVFVHKMTVSMKISMIAGAMLLCLGLAASGIGPSFKAPTARDKCSVCGMFVSKYGNWTAEVLFKDGSYAFFDGPKDLFHFLADMIKYAPARSRSDVHAIFVTDYYAVKPIDAYTAFYVAGSDMRGPMGRELIPFERDSDAREFL
jgi:copper chaperone NosL